MYPQKGSSLIILIVVLLLVGVVGTLLFQNSRSKSPSVEPTDPLLWKLVDTDSWTTVAEPKKGYLLKHPRDWTTSDEYPLDYIVSIISPDEKITIHLVDIMIQDKDKAIEELEKIGKNWEDGRDVSYSIDEHNLGENILLLLKIDGTDVHGQVRKRFTRVVHEDKTATFTLISDDDLSLEQQQIINTIYSTFRYDDSYEGKNLTFRSEELNISFDYPFNPFELGVPYEIRASQGKGGSAREGEDWRRITFSKITRGFEGGFIELSASTGKYQPSSWEGSPHWLNADIKTSDSIDAVREKLIEEKFNVVKVQQQTSRNAIEGFRAWTLDCYVVCSLSHIYIIPIKHEQYQTLLIYSVLESVDGGSPYDRDRAKSVAVDEIKKIESKSASPNVLKYMDRQEDIFNSLEFLFSS